MKSKARAEVSAAPTLNADQRLALQAAMIENMTLMRRDFMKHLIDPRRDLNKECGYPEDIKIEDYKQLYDREGVCTRVVDIFPSESWKHDPEVVENPEGEITPWEQSWIDLEKDLNLYADLTTADQISGIGQYGILLLGINDNKALSEPVDGVDAMLAKLAQTPERPSTVRKPDDEGKKPAAKPQPSTFTAKRKLLYVRSFDQSVLSIKAVDSNPSSPRYGMPTMYSVNLANDKTMGSVGQDAVMQQQQSMDIHWHRAIHIADGCKNSKVYGTPRLQDVFNRGCDIKKTLGGSGEMFYKGGFPGLSFETLPESSAAKMTEPEKKIFRDEISDYQNTLQRYIISMGMTAKSLAPQVADPGPHCEVQWKAMAMSKGIPYRIFIGTEEAKLASGQDKKAWDERMNTRRVKYIAPKILMPLVFQLIAMEVLEYRDKRDLQAIWPVIAKPDAKEQSEVAKNLTDSLVKYIQANADVMISPLDFLTNVWGLDTDVAIAILEKALINEEDGTLDNVEEPTPLDEETQQAGIELTRAKAKQASAAAKVKPPAAKRVTRNEAGDGLITNAVKEKKISMALMRARLRKRFL